MISTIVSALERQDATCTYLIQCEKDSVTISGIAVVVTASVIVCTCFREAVTHQGLLCTGPKQGCTEVPDQLSAGLWAWIKALGLPVVEAITGIREGIACLPDTSGQECVAT